jgi:hypothetical protein
MPAGISASPPRRRYSESPRLASTLPTVQLSVRSRMWCAHTRNRWRHGLSCPRSSLCRSAVAKGIIRRDVDAAIADADLPVGLAEGDTEAHSGQLLRLPTVSSGWMGRFPPHKPGSSNPGGCHDQWVDFRGTLERRQDIWQSLQQKAPWQPAAHTPGAGLAIAERNS